MAVVEFLPAVISVEVSPGSTVLQAARQAGLVIEAPCDAIGTCGKCKVQLLAGKTSQPVGVRHQLSAAERARGWILACQERVEGDVRIGLAESAGDRGLRIASAGETRTVVLDPAIRKSYHVATRQTRVWCTETLIATETGDTRGELYGLAIDIGTTTLVVALIDLRSGAELAVASSLNPQAIHAQDVLSRIRFAGQTGGLTQLRSELIDALNRLGAEAAQSAGVERARIYEAVCSGNTCMLHLATGIDLLLRQVGVAAAELDEVLIAGSFGLHLRPESLLTIGLLPPEVAGRIRLVGNTAKSGSQTLLLNRACRDQLKEIVTQVEVLELANLPEFEKIFVASLGF